MIGLAVLLMSYELPGILKFVMLATATTVITFSLAELVFRRIPVLKRVL